MKVIDIAKTYLGKLEKTGNSGFQDTNFENEMVALGEWQKGYSWCCCFTQLCFRKAYPELTVELKKLFDPGTINTFQNFKKAGYIISSVPTVGSLVIWQDYKAGKGTDRGHAGIVTEVLSNFTFKSIEGNTFGDKPSRNGDRVAIHTHSTGHKPEGLNVLGFITIPKV